MKYRRVLRIAIIMISMVLAYLPYKSEYNIKPVQSDIERGIEEFLEKDVTIVDFMEVDNTLAVYFTLGSNDSIGFTALHKGINSKYQIRKTSISARNNVIHGKPFKTNHGDYLAIIGTNYDHKIAKIKIEHLGEIFTENIQDKSEILTVFSTKSFAYGIEYQLFDNKDNDITDEMMRYITTNKVNVSSNSKVDFYSLYVFGFIIVLLGFVISSMFYENDSKKSWLWTSQD